MKALAVRQAAVVGSDVDLQRAERVAGDIARAGGTVSALRQDTARAEHCERTVAQAVDRYGALHLAVNDAGIGGARASTATWIPEPTTYVSVPDCMLRT